MKTIAIIAAICVGAVFAAIVAKDIDVLLERAEKLAADANKTVADHKAADKIHLLSSVEYELTALTRTINLLKSYEKNVTVRTHELNVLEESLLNHENRINEELEYVQDVYKTYNVANKTADEVIQYATTLVAEVKKEIAAHQAHGHREVFALESEVRSVEDLVKRIQAHPTTSLYNEQSLIRHEKTLRALLQRIQH